MHYKTYNQVNQVLRFPKFCVHILKGGSGFKEFLLNVEKNYNNDFAGK